MENLKKRRGIASNTLVAALTATTLATTGCGVKVTKETEFSIQPTTTTIAYTKDGDPVAPLELVAIDRVEESSDDTESTTTPTPSASASASAETEDKSDSKDSDSKGKEKTKEDDSKTDDTETEETVELADEAYVADGLEVTKVYPEVIDTSVVGDVEVLFTVKDTENNDSTSELSVKFTVFDETAPAFKLSKTDDTVTVGADFDPKSYIKADAGCEYVDEAPENGSKYESGWYTITSNVSTKKAGKYKVIYHAENSSGTATEVTLNIAVKDAETASADNSSKTETKKSQNSNKTQSSSKQNSNSNSYSSNSGNSSSNTNSAYPGMPSWYNGEAYDDIIDGVPQTANCPNRKTETIPAHTVVTGTYQEKVIDQPYEAPVVEEWYRCPTCNAEFSSYDEAMAHITNSSTCGNFVNFLKTVSEGHAEVSHYETRETTVEIPETTTSYCVW